MKPYTKTLKASKKSYHSQKKNYNPSAPIASSMSQKSPEQAGAKYSGSVRYPIRQK
jgi:hypothetical protein